MWRERRGSSRSFLRSRIIRSGDAIEKFDETGFEGILGTDDEEEIFFDPFFDDGRSGFEVADRSADVGTDGVIDEGVGIVRDVGIEEGLHRGTDAAHNRLEIGRAVFAWHF